MVDFHIKIKDISRKARTTELEIKGKKSTTPEIIINHSQYRALRTTSNKFKIADPPSHIENILHVKPENLSGDLKNDFINRIKKNTYRSCEYSIIDHPILHQTIKRIETEHILDLFAAHIDANRSNLFIIPDSKVISPEQWIDINTEIEKMKNSIGSDFRIIPQILMAQSKKSFDHKLNFLKEMQPMAVNMLYRGAESHKNMDKINQLLHQDIWISTTNITKTIKDANVSHPHIVSFRTFDTISSKIPKSGRSFFIRQKDDDGKIIAKKREAHTSMSSSTAPPVEDFIQQELAYSTNIPQYCSCSICNKLGINIHKITDFDLYGFRTYTEYDKAVKSHNIQNQINEEIQARIAIHKDDVINYLENKPAVANSKKKISNVYKDIFDNNIRGNRI